MTAPQINPAQFKKCFARFQSLMKMKSGHSFKGFNEGVADVWEGYKPRLRNHALEILRADDWLESQIGNGIILDRMIAAIEIHTSIGDLTNNLVFWQNRYGHANRDHRLFLEATTKPVLRKEIERLLFDFYRKDFDEDLIFDRLSELTNGKYPLLAYIFFLKDMDRFAPIQPTGFDRAFRALEIDFSTLRRCNWQNYSIYNETLNALTALIKSSANLKNVRLIDAHSFCWIFSALLKQEAEGTIGKSPGAKDPGRTLGSREKSIYTMAYSAQNTVKNANGQVVQAVVKNKELKMSLEELRELIAQLLDLQGNCCALTGIPFQFHETDADKDLLPSLDRIDSDKHYEKGNLQVVCQFINFWKSDRENEDFKRLLMLVRGVEQ